MNAETINGIYLIMKGLSKYPQENQGTQLFRVLSGLVSECLEISKDKEDDFYKLTLDYLNSAAYLSENMKRLVERN